VQDRGRQVCGDPDDTHSAGYERVARKRLHEFERGVSVSASRKQGDGHEADGKIGEISIRADEWNLQRRGKRYRAQK
jgi:hypothetical protein